MSQAQDIYTGFNKYAPNKRLPQTIIDKIEAGVLIFWRNRKDMYTVSGIETARLKLKIVAGDYMLCRTEGSKFADIQEEHHFITQTTSINCAMDREQGACREYYQS